jgi:hypothetical protein
MRASMKQISANVKRLPSINENDYSTSGWTETVKEWDDAVGALETIHGNVVLTSSDNHAVAYKFENVLQDDHLSQPFDTLRRVWGYKGQGLPRPTLADHRHHDADAMMKLHGRKNCGVLHLAAWIPTGQHKLGPVLSKDCIGACYRMRATHNFLASAGPLQRTASDLFRLLEPDSWKRYQQAMDLARSKDSSISMLGPHGCFFGMALVHNLRVLPHVDSGDDKQGFVAMTPIGNFTGGELLLGTHGEMFKLNYKPGDIILFRSAILRHAVAKFEGNRTALVLFSHQDVMDHDWDITSGFPETQEHEEPNTSDGDDDIYSDMVL